MKKYGIGTGIFAIIFGILTYFSFYFVVNINGENVDNLGVFIAFLTIAVLMIVVFFIIGIISGGLTLLFGIITIVRIVKAVKGPKVNNQHSAQTEPTL